MKTYNDFLNSLMKTRHRVVFARITSLSLDETPTEQIEGRVTSGSINIDGDSAVRRTCQLSMVADKQLLSSYHWALDTKFKLEVGLANTIDTNYPDIIWLKQGIYVITSFSYSISANSVSINLSGKDKMCLLNGENGGLLPFEVDFGKWEQINEQNEIILNQYPIKHIIREAVHHYGGEAFHNIVINDLDNRGVSLQEYRYSQPLYLYREANTPGRYFQGTLNGNQEVKILVDEGPETKSIPISELEHYDLLLSNSLIENNSKPTQFYLEDNEKTYCAAKIEYGQAVGYLPQEMVYNGDLIAKAGESVTSVLDKIKQMLSNFEYFYDLDGRFIFQEKQNFLHTAWTPIETIDGGVTVLITENKNAVQFEFYDGELITQFNNSPTLSNIKNDFAIWGTRAGASSKGVPIHLRYAIDIKPIMYKSIGITDSHPELEAYNKQYNTYLLGQESVTYIANTESRLGRYDKISHTLYLTTEINMHKEKNLPILDVKPIQAEPAEQAISFAETFQHVVFCDWREIIYQMAIDYRKYGHLDCFERLVAEYNPELYANGRTGYEQYYVDLEGFWRQLYCYDAIYTEVAIPQAEEMNDYYECYKEFRWIPDITQVEAGTKVYMMTGKDSYSRVAPPYDTAKTSFVFGSTLYLNPDEEFALAQQVANECKVKVKDVNGNAWQLQELITNRSPYFTYEERYVKTIDYKPMLEKTYYRKSDQYYLADEAHPYWNKEVYEQPHKLNFWFDLLDTQGALAELSVRAIGQRQKVDNNKDVKAIYYYDTPQILFGQDIEENEYTGYTHITVPKNYESMFSQSAQGKSAKDVLDNLLFTHGYCNESVNITCLPVYHLEPNRRVYIEDSAYGIGSEYIVSKITIPLSYNGTMSITATKVEDRII